MNQEILGPLAPLDPWVPLGASCLFLAPPGFFWLLLARTGSTWISEKPAGSRRSREERFFLSPFGFDGPMVRDLCF